MILSLLATLLTVPAHGGGTAHTPHPECSGVAVGIRSDGRREVVLASRNETNILKSTDEGLTWQVVTGAGVEQSFPTRISWYPNGAQSAFLISTDRGVFRYDAEAEVINPFSTGIPVDEADLVDLEVSQGGHAQPAIACNDMGAVFVLDPLTDTWSKVLDTGEEDRNAVVAIVPDYDLAGVAGVDQTLAAGINGRLYLSTDGGANWSVQTDFPTAAVVDEDWHITSIAFADDYASSGRLLVGRGRENKSVFAGDEGELWGSSDFGASFAQQTVQGNTLLHSSIQEIVSVGMGPNGDSVWYLTFHFFPQREYQPEAQGVLRSVDGGQTWTDDGNTQDFLQELAPNERTAVGREYRGMMTIAVDPFYTSNGEVWMARSEGVYFSDDEGIYWSRRQLRPSKQVRGVGVGYDSSGDLFAYSATYGSSNVMVNVTDRTSVWSPGSGMAFQLPAVVSPRSFEDGVMASGGQVDMVVRLQDPAPARLQGLWSINDLFAGALGETGYVRTLELSPNFNARGASSDKTIMWAARLKNSNLGETRLSLDGLQSVQLANGVEGFPGERAPWMKSLSISPTFDPITLPQTLDVFGGAYIYEQVWHMKNNGTTADPVFEWNLVNWQPPERVQAVHADPRFSRPNAALLWVITTEGLYRLRDLSADWSNVEVTPFAKFDNLPLAMELPPDMGARPMIYVMTWGGGLQKLDISQPDPEWEQVGIDYPDEWGNCFAFDPDFATTRRIITGGQNGLLLGVDQPGVAWERLPFDYATDNQNPGIAYMDPTDAANPDPARRWGWDILKESDLPQQIDLDFFGNNVTFTESDGAFLEFPRYGSGFSVRAVAGPGMGTMVAQVLDYETGALISTVQQDLNQATYEIAELAVPVTGNRKMWVRVTASLDAGEGLFFDGFRFQE